MASLLGIPASLASLQARIDGALARVERRFDAQLASDLPPVSRLVAHVEHYRGKMLRPTLVMACGLAGGRGTEPELTDAHATIAAVCEMVHMATLVHDDVLDDADTRRRGRTVNRLYGNEAAVILGDYLIASAYHLCSQLDSQAAALLIGRVSMTTCAGELLQLDHRGDFSLDEPAYFEIVQRKTAALISAACRLGAWASGADEEACLRLERFGRDTGVAFQIQDDVLDLVGDEAVVGKSTGKDLEKGKLTLPIILHLNGCSPVERGRSLLLLERASGADAAGRREAAARLVARLESTGSIGEARRCAANLVERAKGELAGLPESPARLYLLAMADALVNRAV
ncbi:MAG: polyprenyl synthetase family protein [Phycisphaerales bacterium]